MKLNSITSNIFEYLMYLNIIKNNSKGIVGKQFFFYVLLGFKSIICKQYLEYKKYFKDIKLSSQL